jgi:excisionase family DNA binding protein
LLERIGQLIDSRLNKAANPNEQKAQSKFITRKEVAKLLKISLATLNDWTKQKIVQSYKIGNRVLYKEQEILAAVDKVATFKHKKGGLGYAA